jgi:hypothetical protein
VKSIILVADPRFLASLACGPWLGLGESHNRDMVNVFLCTLNANLIVQTHGNKKRRMLWTDGEDDGSVVGVGRWTSMVPW